jgi:hypothetical protein
MDAPEPIEQGADVVVAHGDGGDLLLIDRAGSRSFLLSPGTGFRWEHCDGQCCVNQLVDLMREEHEARRAGRQGAAVDGVLDLLVKRLPGTA